jgi:alpha-L-arabinofuranosidase
MYGIFFEDINFGADGGLYAELIKNRSFEFDNALVGWMPFGHVKIMDSNPCFEKNPHYARLTYTNELTGTGLENEGFRGMGLKAGETYNFSAFIRCNDAATMKIKIELLNISHDIIESREFEASGNSWKKYSIALTPKMTQQKASLRLTLLGRGSVDVDHISLFPQKTFKNRTNGMREDLAQALADLKPAIFRFPGGCIVEGTNLATRYQWKNTIGPVENRPTNINRWNYTFPHKKFSDYYQSYGLGFYEYFQLSEDIGATPLPVLNCGLSCQFENHDPNENCAVENLQPYIQDALDLIEFANGTPETPWGKMRAEMGHPQSFNLKYIAIGNEQWGSIYPERMALFVKAIRKQYPGIQIVGTVGPFPDGKDFEYGWAEMKKIQVDLADEHYYKSPEWFLKNANRYDNYDRKAPKVFAGEYACHAKDLKNSFESALCEAAFMTGFERNADVVRMCTYAPLFAHVEAWQWKPDMIWFDNLNCVKTPNYYVQQLYAHNPGTHVLTTRCQQQPLEGQNGLYGSSALDKNKNQILLKIANVSNEKWMVKYSLDGLKPGVRQATMTVYSNPDMNAENTLENPFKVIPVERPVSVTGNTFDLELEAASFYLVKILL